MKATKWLVILIAGAVVLTAVTGSFGRSKKLPAKTAAVERKVANDIVVDGYGETAEAARANALRKAIEVVEVRLRERMTAKREIPSHLTTPTNLETWKVIAEEGKPEKDPDAEDALRARYKIALSDAYVTDVVNKSRAAWIEEERAERQECVVERHLSLARILGGVLAVLLVVAGYLRLEEATRGYYTAMLRVAAIGALLAAALGLFMTL